jgi:hypothetical protein
MTRFLDGPAKGVTLLLHRAPRILRAVRDPGGKWDALDQLGDVPEPNEAIYIYLLAGRPAVAHISLSRGRGGFYPLAEYRYSAVQPGPEVDVRDTAGWRRWSRENFHRATIAPPPLDLATRERAAQSERKEAFT